MHRRALNVFVIVDELRRIHPELSAPLRGTRLWDVLAREGITVKHNRRIGQPARSSGFDGDYTIRTRRGLRPRDAWGWSLHEYGHIKLGHLGDEGEFAKNLTPCMPDDPREDDANLFATLVFLGPTATPDTPRVARIIAKIEARRYRQRPVKEEEQLQLGISRGVPMYKHPAWPAGSGEHGSYNPDPYPPRYRHQAPRIKVGDSHESLLFDWSRDGKPLRYFHLQLGWLDVWDTMPATKPGRSREILVAGDRRATWRDFIISSTDRRRYVFTDREKRSRTPKDLNHQLERAQRVTISEKSDVTTSTHARRD